MIASLALGFVLLAGFLAGGPAHASFSDEHLDLLDVTEVVDEYGLIVFTGSVRNTHAMQSIKTAIIYVILKQDGKIIAIYRGFPDRSLEKLAPGETRSFEVETDHAEGEYDAFNVRVEGVLEPPDASLITGSFGIVEESLNLTQTSTGWAVFYGELFNGTNALIRRVEIMFTLMNRRGDVVGFAFPDPVFGTLEAAELWPGETIDFAAISILTPSLIDTWEIELTYEVVRIVEETIPTVADGRTWGQIKNHSRAESAR